MHQKPWTTEEQTLLRKMWRDPDITSQQLIDQFGRTWDAIRVKARVYNLSGRGAPGRQAKTRSQAPDGEELPLEETEPGLYKETPPVGRCQYPIGDPRDRETFSFCGRAVPGLGRSYCERHHAKCYRPWRTR